MCLPVASAPGEVFEEAVSPILGLLLRLLKFSRRSQRISDREAEIAQLRAAREAALEGDLSDSSDGEVDELDEEGNAERERRKEEHRRAKALAKAEALAAQLRQLEDSRTGRPSSGASSEDDDAMWDYMDIDLVLPPRLADLDTNPGR